LFNQIREGSLVAVRSFSDHPPQQSGESSCQRDPAYEEYSILQIDQVHPWHYAIQGSGDQGYPAFTTKLSQENSTRHASRIGSINLPVDNFFAFCRNGVNGAVQASLTGLLA
jgi:hypothetical protein